MFSSGQQNEVALGCRLCCMEVCVLSLAFILLYSRTEHFFCNSHALIQLNLNLNQYFTTHSAILYVLRVCMLKKSRLCFELCRYVRVRSNKLRIHEAFYVGPVSDPMFHVEGFGS